MNNFFLHFFGLFENMQNFILNISRDDLGWLSAIFLTLCSVPQLWKTIKDGHCKGLSAWFVGLWVIGEWFGLIYLLPTNQYPLIFNYFMNAVVVSIIMVYKIRRG